MEIGGHFLYITNNMGRVPLFHNEGYIEAGLFWIGQVPICCGALLSLKIQALCSQGIHARGQFGGNSTLRYR
jgi:hypothetical protein